MMETAATLRAFVESMPIIDEERPLYKEGEIPPSGSENPTFRVRERRLGAWCVGLAPGFNDFNKEVAHPGVLDGFPDGAVGVRSDDDFWVEALLPYRFRDLTIQEIVGVLWPDIENPRFHKDVSAFVAAGARHRLNDDESSDDESSDDESSDETV